MFKIKTDSTDDLPTFNQFRKFLISHFGGLENLENKVDGVSKE